MPMAWMKMMKMRSITATPNSLKLHKELQRNTISSRVLQAAQQRGNTFKLRTKATRVAGSHNTHPHSDSTSSQHDFTQTLTTIQLNGSLKISCCQFIINPFRKTTRCCIWQLTHGKKTSALILKQLVLPWSCVSCFRVPGGRHVCWGSSRQQMSLFCCRIIRESRPWNNFNPVFFFFLQLGNKFRSFQWSHCNRHLLKSLKAFCHRFGKSVHSSRIIKWSCRCEQSSCFCDRNKLRREMRESVCFKKGELKLSVHI